MIAVDRCAQGQGAGTALAGVATGWLRQPGMLVAVIETGGGLGHARARRSTRRPATPPCPLSGSSRPCSGSHPRIGAFADAGAAGCRAVPAGHGRGSSRGIACGQVVAGAGRPGGRARGFRGGYGRHHRRCRGGSDRRRRGEPHRYRGGQRVGRGQAGDRQHAGPAATAAPYEHGGGVMTSARTTYQDGRGAGPGAAPGHSFVWVSLRCGPRQRRLRLRIHRRVRRWAR